MTGRRPISMWLFLVPALGIYFAFFALPIVESFAVSLFQWSAISPRPDRFVGLHNYARLVHDSVFWWSLVHNLVLLVLSLVIQLPVAIFLAALLSGRVFARAFFRTAFFAPMILPSVVIAIVWMRLYAPPVWDGLFVKLLASAGLPYPVDGFLGDRATALVAVILTISWRFTGFHMVLFMAGIESIPEELYEAARVDGAGAWGCFRWVTLPSLAPVVRISAVLSIIGSLKYFDLVWVMTGDGTSSGTELMTTWMYQNGIVAGEGGYGSALAVAGFLASALVVAAVFALTRRSIQTGGAPA